MGLWRGFGMCYYTQAICRSLVIFAVSILTLFSVANAWEPVCYNTNAPGPADLCLAKDPHSFQLEARQGEPFQIQLRNTYTATTLPFLIDTGSTPPGLTLSSNGLLSGTPSTVGVFNFTVRQTVSSTDIRRLYVHLVVTAAQDRFKRYDFSNFGPYTVQYQNVTIPFPYPIEISGATSSPAVVAAPIVSDGSRFPIYFFLHGTGINPANYEQYLRRIASWGFIAVAPRVTSYDTGWPRITTAMNGVVQVRQVYDATMNFLSSATSYQNLVDTTRVAGGGHSMGGDVASLFAYSLPKLIATVVIDPAGNTVSLQDITHNLGVYYEPTARIPTMTIGMCNHTLPTGGYGFLASGHSLLYGRDTGPKAWLCSMGTHAGFTNGSVPAYGTIPEEMTAEQLPVVTHFTVAHLLRFLYDDISVNGALYSDNAFDQNNSFQTPFNLGYSYAFDRYGYQGINTGVEKIVDDFRDQYPGNEVLNTTYNNFTQTITDTTYPALEGPPQRFNPSAQTLPDGYNHFLTSSYRVRQLNNFSLGKAYTERLGSSSAPFNSTTYTHLLLNWTKLTEGELGPVSVRLKDSSGSLSNLVSATPIFRNRSLPHSVEIDLSAFSGINRSALTEIQLSSGAATGTNFDLDDIRFVKGQVCKSDAMGLHPHYYSNALPSGQYMRFSACGMRDLGENVVLRAENLPAGTVAQFYLSLDDNPVALFGGILVPNSTALRSRIFNQTVGADGSATLTIPGYAQAAQIYVQVVAQVSGMPTGERVMSEPLLLRQNMNLMGGGGGGSGVQSTPLTIGSLTKKIKKANRKHRLRHKKR